MMRRHAIATALAMGMAVPGLPAASEPANPATTAGAREFVFDLPLSMDARVVGELTAVIRGSELTAIDAVSWRAFGPRQFGADVVDEIAAQAVDGRIPVTAFAEARLALRYDPGLLVLYLQPQGDQRVMRALSMQPALERLAPVADGAEGRLASYVNLRALQSYAAGRSGDASGFRLVVDGATRVFGARGVALEWSGVYDGEAPNDWTRGEVRLVHDDVARAIRYAAGDVGFLSTEFQGAVPLLGLSVERRFNTLRPLRTMASTGPRSFVLSRPSRVTVFINGAMQRTFQLDPGRYGLNDFATVDGANDVRIEVEDDAGKREVIEFTLFLDATLLRAGDSEFSVNAGYRREDDAQAQIGYDFDRPAWSSFLRYGVSDSVTVGASYQGERALDVVGIEGVTATPLGAFATSLSMSRPDAWGTGRAATARWSYDLRGGMGMGGHRVDLSTIHFSRRYLPLGLDEPFNRYAWQTQARLTTSLPFGLAGAFNTRYARARGVGESDETRLGLVLFRRFGRLSATFGIERVRGEDDDVRAYVNALLPLGRDRNVSAGWQSLDNQTQVQWSHYPTERVGNVSGSVGAEYSDLGSAATLDAAYVGNRFSTRVQHDIARAGARGASTVQDSRLQFDAAIAFVDGQFAVGRPITDAFAIVSRHRSLHGSEVHVDPGVQGPLAIADRFGPALVPRLLSYRPQQLRLDVLDLPDGYDLGDTVRELQPAYRSGYRYQAGSAASLAAVGVAVGPDGAPLVLTGGELRADDGRDFPPAKTFTNRSGRFAVQGLAPGRYVIAFFAETPRVIRFDVRDDAGGLLDLGTLTTQDP